MMSQKLSTAGQGPEHVAEFFGWTNMVPSVKIGNKVNCGLGTFTVDGADELEGDVFLAIRPEAAMVHEDEDGIEAIIRSSTYMGTRTSYIVDHQGIQLTISLENHYTHRDGDIIHITFDPGMVWVVGIEHHMNEDAKGGPAVSAAEKKNIAHA